VRSLEDSPRSSNAQVLAWLINPSSWPLPGQTYRPTAAPRVLASTHKFTSNIQSTNSNLSPAEAVQ
jgi:hypothetical protein